MRVRHGLKLDEADDFDMVTQDAALKVWDQVSQATFLALVVISSIALMVGGIGVMAIMTISVTERTREIGVRKALGARRQEILFQFLAEAVVLTLGRRTARDLLGAGIGVTVHARDRLPHLAPVVVVRARPRLLGRRRHFLRNGAGGSRRAPRSNRGAAVRVSCFSSPSLPVRMR